MTSMYVIEVIPFAKGAPAGSLSYRSGKKHLPGTLVTVTLRKKRVRGIVVAVTDVLEEKASLKRASFSLAGSVEEIGTLDDALVLAVSRAAQLHGASMGAAFSQLLDGMLGEGLPGELLKGPGFSLDPVEVSYAERLTRYRTLCEGATGAVLIVVPTLAEAARLKSALKSFKPLVLSGAVTPARREAALANAYAGTGLVIATSAFSFVPIRDLSRIIIERPSAGSYRQQKRPYLDMIRALQALAEARKVPLLLGDYPLPLEYRPEPDASLTEYPLGTVSILNIKKEEEKQGVAYQAVPEPIREAIGEALIQGGRAAVFAVRRGYAPAVICRDCGTAVKDAKGRGLALVTVQGTRVLRASDGTSLTDADAVCDSCGSWNLLPLGVGVERVEEELRVAFPDVSIVRFDADTIRTPAQARKALLLIEEPGSIAVGTEFLLPWLDPEKPLAFAGIASADSLLALPFWRARERLVRFGLALRERARQTMIATRRADDTALAAIEHPSDTGFFAEETMLRKVLKYPPFATILSITAAGTPEKLDAAHAVVQHALRDQALSVMPDRRTENGASSRTWIAKLPEGAWPDRTLAERLAMLPPSMRLLVDPDSLW